MSWTNLKATISAVIKGNDNQEITGPLLKGVLNAIVNNLGANAQFAGIATPETRFVISDGPIFWMTTEAGTYNLNGEEVTVENATLAIFIWDCSTWSAILVPISGVATVDMMNTAIASALTSYYTKSEVNAALGDKVDKVAGKGLSTNDYTDAEKEKLAELENYDDTQVRQLINEEKTTRQQGDNALSESITQEETRAKGAEQTLQLAIDIINGKIPAQATAQNQLADKSFVNSSISTATADFKGTYNSLEELEQVTANANDYAFVVATDAAGNTVYKRYKWVEGTGWRWEYNLNNSSFTAAQWAAIQSGITAALVTKLSDLPTNAELNQRISTAIATALLNYYTKSEIDAALENKQDVIQDLSAIRSGAQAGSTAYQKPQGGIPSTDMSQEVQTSLEKANTALQEHQSLDAYAKNDGYYEGMGVGTADNLTGQTERTDDAMYRKVGGSEEVASGTATITNIKGNTVAWNQLVPDSREKSQNLYFYPIHDGFFPCINRNKYYIKIYAKSNIIDDASIVIGTRSAFASSPCVVTSPTTGYKAFSYIREYYQNTSVNNSLRLAIDGYSGTLSFKNCQVINLTLIYGAGNEPTTPEQFEADYFKWFGKPLTYEEYDACSLRSVQLDSLKTTGFNWLKTLGKTQHIQANRLFPEDPREFSEGEYWNGVSYNGHFIPSQTCTNVNIQDGRVSGTCRYNAYGIGFPMRCFSNTQYYKSSGITGVAIFDRDGVYITNARYTEVFTTPNNAAWMMPVIGDTVGNFDMNNLIINISGDRNGGYEPYEEHSVSLPVTTITGKLNGEGESVVVFSDGMKSAGTAYDEIYTVGDKTYAVKRIGSADLGDSAWVYSNQRFISGGLDNKELSNIYTYNTMMGAYVYSSSIFDDFNSAPDKSYCNVNNQRSIAIKDTSYTDAASFKVAMQGVMLYYKLATPQVYELDTFDLPKPYQVDGNGTEEQIQKSGVQGLAAILTILYGVDAVGILNKLPQNYISEKSMDNFLAQLNTVTGGTWTKTWNENTGEWDFSFTANAQTDDINTDETI